MTNKINKAKLIAFVAGKQSGKTLASQYLCDKYGYIKLSLGDPLKYAMKDIFGFTDEQLWGNKKEDIDEFWGISPRYAMQLVGTDFFRDHMKEKVPHIGDRIWVLILERNIKKAMSEGKLIVVDDLRFINEQMLIKKYDGTIMRIERATKIQNNDTHKSELQNQQIMADYVIENNGTINEFYDKIDIIMNVK